jgi:hypothetical protein
LNFHPLDCNDSTPKINFQNPRFHLSEKVEPLARSSMLLTS